MKPDFTGSWQAELSQCRLFSLAARMVSHCEERLAEG
jgi:hypothetical protein